MRRKGYNFRHAPHLTFRAAQERDMERCSEKDTLPSGSYCVVVSKKDCTVGSNGFITHKSIEAAKCRPFSAWSRTNMLYGNWRKQTRGRHVWVKLSDLSQADQDHWKIQIAAEPDLLHDGWVYHYFPVYWTCPVYWVEDAAVYTSSITSTSDPAERKAA